MGTTEKAEKKSVVRIPEIDIAKGVGILLVVIGHNLPVESMLRNYIYTFHIPLFFVLSGMTFSSNPKRIGLNTNNTIKAMFQNRLWCSYIFWSAIYLLYDIVIRVLITKEVGIRRIGIECYMTLTFYGINVLWFLSTLIIVELCARKIRTYTENKMLVLAITTFTLGMVTVIAPRINQLDVGAFRIVYYPMVSLLRPVAMLFFSFLELALKIF